MSNAGDVPTHRRRGVFTQRLGKSKMDVRLSLFTAHMTSETVLKTVAPSVSSANRQAHDESTRKTSRRTWLSAGARAGLASGLLLQIVLIHLIDQDWFAFAKDPSYVQTGYAMIEVTGLIAACLLLVRRNWWLWLATFGLGAGPLFGYILSRSIGMPNYRDDIGNWTEPLGVTSVVVECAVMLLAVRPLLDAWRQRRF